MGQNFFWEYHKNVTDFRSSSIEKDNSLENPLFSAEENDVSKQAYSTESYVMMDQKKEQALTELQWKPKFKNKMEALGENINQSINQSILYSQK